jgi:hypothetical protein
MGLIWHKAIVWERVPGTRRIDTSQQLAAGAKSRSIITSPTHLHKLPHAQLDGCPGQVLSHLEVIMVQPGAQTGNMHHNKQNNNQWT